MVRYFFLYSTILVFILSTGFSLNLTLTDYHNPIANHILDAEITGDILIVSAMVQGIEFYNISNPGYLSHLTNFNLTGVGGWGGGAKSNCVRAIGDYAYFTSSNGLYVVNFSNPANPQSLGLVSGTSNLILENLDLEENILAICAHTDGVLLYDISNPASPNYITQIETDNAWTVVISDEIAYIGNNDQIMIADIGNISNPTIIGTIDLGNAVKDLAISDGFLYAALGSNGVNIYDITSQYPHYLDNYNTNTLANRISPFGNKLAIADWDDVEVLEWNGESLNQVGYKNTGNRTMAIVAKGEFIYSAEWASIQVFEFGEIEGADIDLSTWELNYPYVQNGSSYSLSVDIFNNGNTTLTTIDNYTTNSEFTLVNPITSLAPGEIQTVEVIYSASNSNASGAYRIYSNDPDEPEIICETNGNIDGANVGASAPNFELDYVANGSGSFKLSDHLGEVIVLAFFAPN